MSYSYLAEENRNHEFPALGVVSTWFGAILIVLTAVGQTSFDVPNHFWAEPIVAGMNFILVAFILASLLYLVGRAAQGLKLAALPLIINIGTLTIVQFVPFAALWHEFNFQWRAADYNAVVRLVEQGAIQPDDQGLAILPAKYRHLSSENGLIMIDMSQGNTRLFFLESHGAAGNFAGYMYRSDENPPQAGEFNGRWWEIKQKRPHWFYCVSR